MTTKRREYLIRKFAGIVDVISIVLAIVLTLVGIFSTGVITINGGSLLLLVPALYRLATNEEVGWFDDWF